MAAKHFRSDDAPTGQEDSDAPGYKPRHAAGNPKAQVTPEGWSGGSQAQAQVEGRTVAGRPVGRQGGAASGPSVRAGRGTGWYYGEPAVPQAGRSAAHVPSDGGRSRGSAGKGRRHAGPSRRILAACVGGACVVAVVVGLGIWSSRQGVGGTANVGQAAAGQQVGEPDGGATPTSPSSADANANASAPAPAGDASQEGDATPDTLSAADVLSRTSSLSHGGADCSLPADGAEVDVRDGRVLVAYQSADDAQGTVSRMAAAAAALAQELSGSTLTDSSTAEGGVSQVPAVSAPAAITSSDEGSAFGGVEVVALGQGRYVIGAVSLATADGLGDAGESAILSAATGYAIEGPAYRYSGLYARGIAQSKGDAPALLTGEKIIMRMSVPQPSQGTASGGAGSTSGGTSASAGSGASTRARGGSAATSTSASTSRNATGARGSSRSGSTTGASSRRGTGYYGGGSGYAGGSGHGTGSRAGSGYGTGSGTGGSASGPAASGASARGGGATTQ